jgi:hypothetical protein
MTVPAPMSREQAQRRAAQLNREHPERTKFRWFARKGLAGWHVARVAVPGEARLEPLKPTIGTRPRPPTRPTHAQRSIP